MEILLGLAALFVPLYVAHRKRRADIAADMEERRIRVMRKTQLEKIRLDGMAERYQNWLAIPSLRGSAEKYLPIIAKLQENTNRWLEQLEAMKGDRDARLRMAKIEAAVDVGETLGPQMNREDAERERRALGLDSTG